MSVSWRLSETSDSISLEQITRSGTSGLYVKCAFNFSDATEPLPSAVPPAGCEGPGSSPPSPTLGVVIRSDGALCGFRLRFPYGSWLTFLCVCCHTDYLSLPSAHLKQWSSWRGMVQTPVAFSGVC